MRENIKSEKDKQETRRIQDRNNLALPIAPSACAPVSDTKTIRGKEKFLAGKGTNFEFKFLKDHVFRYLENNSPHPDSG